MDKMIGKLLGICLAAIPFSLYGEVWSLDSCISYAVEHNITVRQQQSRVIQGEQDIIEAKDRFLPTMEASGSQSFNFGRGLTSDNTYADRNTSSFGWNVGFSLPLFQGLSEYRNLELTRLSLKQYIYERESTKDNVALNVISQYLQVLYCREVARSARNQAELSAFEVERQKELIDAGKVAEATLYDLEAVASQDRLQVLTADNDVETALVNLANLLQLATAEGFDIESIDHGEPLIPDPEDVYDKAMAGNNSILGARQAVKVAEQSISVAKSGYIPTLRFNAGVESNFYRLSGIRGESFGAQMRNNMQTYVGFSLSVPIFDGFNTRNSVRRAYHRKNDAELALEQRASDLYKDIRLAYYQAKGARERYLSSGETLEKTRLSFESTRERFNLGRATQADYEQAKNNLFRTEITRIQAHYEYLLRYRILMHYSESANTSMEIG